jgi:hypothetical protein
MTIWTATRAASSRPRSWPDQFSPFSSRLAGGDGLVAGSLSSSSGGSQLSQELLSAPAGNSYSSYANYSMNNLTQGLSFTA